MINDGRKQLNMYLQLFTTFFELGLFTIGGGMAMIPLMEGIIVEKKGWMNKEEMIDCLGVSQSIPGVIAINMATFIGYEKKGILGALAATAGVILPSFGIIIGVVELLHGFEDNSYVSGALIGIKSAVVGLVILSAYKIGKKVLKGWFTWMLAAVSFVAIAFLHINAVWFILAGIFLGIVHKKLTEKKRRKDEVKS